MIPHKNQLIDIMNKFLWLLVLSSLTGCHQAEGQNQIKESTSKGHTDCEKSALFGDREICLPFIDGMTESYAVPAVKARADRFRLEGSTILAYYLNNATYRNIKEINELQYDDYIQIYTLNKAEGIKIGTHELDQVAKATESSFIKANWSDVSDRISQKFENVSVGKPVLLESYAPNRNVRTAILLTKYQAGNYENVIIMALNMVQVKERLVALAYYKDYDGAESVRKSKAKNDYIVLQLLDVNE